MISSEVLPTPPVGYWGGSESFVWDLSCELVRQGHEVTLIARPGSKMPGGKLFETFPDVVDTIGVNERHFNAYKDFIQRLAIDGIVHDHSLGKLARTIHNMVIQTPHFCQHPLSMGNENTGFRNITAASKIQARWMQFKICQYYNEKNIVEQIPQFPVIHHGIDPNRFTYRNKNGNKDNNKDDKGDYYLFFSVLSTYKGAFDVLTMAKELIKELNDVKFYFAGKDGNISQSIIEADRETNGRIKYIGQVSNERRSELYANAKALIFPTGSYTYKNPDGTLDEYSKKWIDIFGLVILEAFASGIPVISSARGACPEIIKHSKTGFICKTYEEMRQTVRDNKVADIRGVDCRKEVDIGGYFNIKRCADQYIESYKKLW